MTAASAVLVGILVVVIMWWAEVRPLSKRVAQLTDDLELAETERRRLQKILDGALAKAVHHQTMRHTAVRRHADLLAALEDLSASLHQGEYRVAAERIRRLVDDHTPDSADRGGSS